MVKTEIKDVRDSIIDHLENKEERKLPWLAKQTGYSYAHLYFILKKKERPITAENVRAINEALGTSFKL